MRSWKARRALVVLAVLAIFAFGGSVVLAAIPTGGGTIYACYGKSSGAMRVVNYPSVKCTSSERLLSWTQVGPKAPPLAAIGIANVGKIDSSFDINPDSNNAILGVFVETGSASTNCLATLQGAYVNGQHANVPVDLMFCTSRNVTLADGQGHWGLLLTMVMRNELPAGDGYTVNVYQEGAKSYGTPMKCDMPGCNG